MLALLLAVVATVAITIWWIQRPIKPVVLSAQEKATVDEKLRLTDRHAPARLPGRGPGGGSPVAGASADTNADPGQDRPYVPGSKVFRLTEREINGLLNANTDLGKSVRLEFARDAINAYVVVPIPKDFPVGMGTTT